MEDLNCYGNETPPHESIISFGYVSSPFYGAFKATTGEHIYSTNMKNIIETVSENSINETG
ncbi:unnamed protein product, partial [Dovyalis caffra]